MTAFDTVGVTTDGYLNVSPLKSPCRLFVFAGVYLKVHFDFKTLGNDYFKD